MGIRVIVVQNPREVAAAQAAQARGAAQEAAQQAREAAQQARDQAEQARDIARAKLEAARAEREARELGGAGGDGSVVTVTKDGVTMTLKDASPEAIATALGMPLDRGATKNDVPMMGIFCTATVFITWLILRYRMQMRRPSSAAALPADLTDRLSRMEAGIESMAVEVERISEGQRFTTRLLVERPQVEEVPRG